MDRSIEPLSFNRPMRLLVLWRRGPVGPAWAALCGAAASGALRLSVDPLLHLALLLFLVEGVWGGLWSALAATDWATPLRQWRDWRRGAAVRFWPRAAPDAPAGRLAQSLGHLRTWWAESLGPTLGPTLSGVALLLFVALVVAGVLGTRPLLVTLAAISLLQFVFAWSGGDARPVPGAQALYEIALPWLAGQVLFGPVRLPSLLLGLAFAFSYAGGLRLVGNSSGLIRWNLGQVAAIVVLVAVRQPMAAGVAGLLLLGHAVAQPGLFDAETEEIAPPLVGRFFRLAQPWLMAAMLVAAWGVGAAG